MTRDTVVRRDNTVRAWKVYRSQWTGEKLNADPQGPLKRLAPTSTGFTRQEVRKGLGWPGEVHQRSATTAAEPGRRGRWRAPFRSHDAARGSGRRFPGTARPPAPHAAPSHPRPQPPGGAWEKAPSRPGKPGASPRAAAGALKGAGPSVTGDQRGFPTSAFSALGRWKARGTRGEAPARRLAAPGAGRSARRAPGRGRGRGAGEFRGARGESHLEPGKPGCGGGGGGGSG